MRSLFCVFLFSLRTDFFWDSECVVPSDVHAFLSLRVGGGPPYSERSFLPHFSLLSPFYFLALLHFCELFPEYPYLRTTPFFPPRRSLYPLSLSDAPASHHAPSAFRFPLLLKFPPFIPITLPPIAS